MHVPEEVTLTASVRKDVDSGHSQPRVLPRAKDRDYPWLRDNADGKARRQDELYDLDIW